MQVNLNHALDTQWRCLTAAVNLLEERELDSVQDVTSYISAIERLLDTESHDSRLVLLDSQGNCYDSSGKHGVWSDLGILTSGEDQYTFISESLVYRGSYWNFVQKLDAPIHVKEDDIGFTHVVLLKDVQDLTKYYSSASYANQNETYILKSNGTRMNDGLSQEKMIQSYNVLNTLEEMGGDQIREALAQTDTLSGNFIRDGVEYYYCVTALRSYHPAAVPHSGPVCGLQDSGDGKYCGPYAACAGGGPADPDGIGGHGHTPAPQQRPYGSTGAGQPAPAGGNERTAGAVQHHARPVQGGGGTGPPDRGGGQPGQERLPGQRQPRYPR